MKRLTRKKLGSSYPLKNTASAKIGLFTDYDGFYAFFEAVNRLGEIEDILGDDYDLSRLHDLVQADRDGRCVVLPCKVGERLWCINSYGEVEETVAVGFLIENESVQTVAVGFLIENESVRICYREKMFLEYYNAPIGKVLFLNREAAEKAINKEDKNEKSE